MIILDTHTLVWWLSNPEKLSIKAKKTIAESIKKDQKVLVSSINIWEIAILFKKGKLESDMDVDLWLAKVEGFPFLQFVPVDNAIAVRSVMLPGQLHKDPADRIIIATAREYGAVLLTSDRKIRKYPHVQTVW